MRTRQNTDLKNSYTLVFGAGEFDFTRHYHNGSQESRQNTSSNTWYLWDERKTSVMSDVVGRFHRSNPVTHITRTTKASSSGPWLYTGASSYDDYYDETQPLLRKTACYNSYQGYWDFENQVQPYPPGWVIELPNVSDAEAVGELKDRARAPVIQGLLDLVEAPELSRTYRSFTNWSELKRPKWSRMRKACRSLTRGASDKYLATIFGIAPLIADANTLMRYLKHMKSDYEKYKSGESRRVGVRYRGKATFTPHPDTDPDNPAADWFHNKTGQAGPVDVRYTMLFRERIPSYHSDFFKALDFYLTRFGSEGPASFAWERVPYSFVVDWFVNVGGILESADNLLKEDPIIIQAVTKSVRFTTQTDVHLYQRSDPASGWIYEHDPKLLEQHVTYYNRQPVTDYGPRPLLAAGSGFGKKQWLTSLALLRQRI